MPLPRRGQLLRFAQGVEVIHFKKLFAQTVEGKTVTVKAKSVTEFLPGVLKWQPLGDSNPCDGTENPAS